MALDGSITALLGRMAESGPQPARGEAGGGAQPRPIAVRLLRVGPRGGQVAVRRKEACPWLTSVASESTGRTVTMSPLLGIGGSHSAWCET
jgi:hypothetical protein